MIETKAQAVKFLRGFFPKPEHKFPGSFGLSRMKYLVRILGNPQRSYPTIHVGGTSGKGSTATIIASILSTKYKTGLLTSPHLVSVNERIRINGKDISDKDFIDLLNMMIPEIEKMEKTEWGNPSYFEILTAIGFLHFKKQKVDLAVIEVGLGGRVDGTNVIQPEVAVITNVGLDHTEILGNTVEKIASEKAGIIKPGIAVITGVVQPSVIKIIKNTATEQSAQLSLLDRDFHYRIKKIDLSGSIFDYISSKRLKNLKLRLLGRHQVINASLALRAVEMLQLKLPEKRLLINANRKGLEEAFIPGRLEIVSRQPLVVLDGAHNPDKIKVAVEAIAEIIPDRMAICVLAIKSDKNAGEMIRQLIPSVDSFILTQFSSHTDLGKTLSYDPYVLQQLIRNENQTIKTYVVSNPRQALKNALLMSGENDLILCTGSLYLLGEIRSLFFNNMSSSL